MYCTCAPVTKHGCWTRPYKLGKLIHDFGSTVCSLIFLCRFLPRRHRAERTTLNYHMQGSHARVCNAKQPDTPTNSQLTHNIGLSYSGTQEPQQLLSPMLSARVLHRFGAGLRLARPAQASVSKSLDTENFVKRTLISTISVSMCVITIHSLDLSPFPKLVCLIPRSLSL